MNSLAPAIDASFEANRKLVVGLSPGRTGRVQGALPGFTVIGEGVEGAGVCAY